MPRWASFAAQIAGRQPQPMGIPMFPASTTLTIGVDTRVANYVRSTGGNLSQQVTQALINYFNYYSSRGQTPPLPVSGGGIAVAPAYESVTIVLDRNIADWFA